MYAPHRIFRKWISRKIYHFADKRYGVEARGEVRGFKVVNGVGISNFTDKQKEMLKKWHFWMRIKNKIYNSIKY